MEDPKKRSNDSCDKKFKKKVKIETAVDAVRALDDIVLGPVSPSYTAGRNSCNRKIKNSFIFF